MSEKEAPSEEATEPTEPASKNTEAKEPTPSTPPEPKPETEEEKPPTKEKQKRKEKTKRRAKLTVLQAAVLETIRERPQRPQAIQTIIRGVGGVDVPRNEIIRSLNELKQKGLVDKVTSKAWQAK